MFSHTTCGMLYWSCCFTSRSAAFSNPLLMKLTWPRSHSLVIFALDLLCYKEGADASTRGSSGHHCPWSVFLLVWHHCHSCDIEIFELLVPGAFSLPTTAVNTCTRPYSASLSFIVQAFHSHIAIIEHVLHHIDVWTSTILPWFLPRIEGKVHVLVEAEGHVMTTAVISCGTSFSVSTCHVGTHR